MAIWDIQTGVVIKDIPLRSFGEMVVSGNQRTTIALFMNGTFRAYDGLTGTQLCNDTPLPSPQYRFGGHWTHGESLRFATISDADREQRIVRVFEFQPTSATPLLEVNSFLVPFFEERFCFCPITSHASCITSEEVVVFDVHDPKILFRVKVSRYPNIPRGCFSPDGRFFACEAQEMEISVWKNTPTGYVTWSVLRPRLLFDGFSFSPSGTSILSWGPGGTQLLDNNNHLTSPPVKIGSGSDHRRHLVAYSKDESLIVTARQGCSVVTILDTLSGTPKRSINLSMKIRDLFVVNDTIYVTDACELVSWNLEAWGAVQSVHDTNRVAVDLADHVHRGDVDLVALSKDCSQIAFTTWNPNTIFLYDLRAQDILDKRYMDNDIMNIQFSPNIPHPYIITYDPSVSNSLWKLEIGEDRRFAAMTELVLPDEWSMDSLLRPHHGYSIWSGFEWVEDSGGNKVLWLPPSWRTEHGLDARWNSNFLALVSGHHPVPIILEFQPPCLPPAQRIHDTPTPTSAL